MSEPIAVAAGETGLVRVFSAPSGFGTLRTAKEAGDAAALAGALGARDLDPAFVDVLSVADLAPLTLTDYLIEGVGVRADAAERDRARLDALPGAAVVLSRAVAGRTEALVPVPGLTLVGTYPEDRARGPVPALASEGARGTLGPPPRQPLQARGAGGTLPRGFVLVALGLVAAAALLLLLLG